MSLETDSAPGPEPARDLTQVSSSDLVDMATSAVWLSSETDVPDKAKTAQAHALLVDRAGNNVEDLDDFSRVGFSLFPHFDDGEGTARAIEVSKGLESLERRTRENPDRPVVLVDVLSGFSIGRAIDQPLDFSRALERESSIKIPTSKTLRFYWDFISSQGSILKLKLEDGLNVAPVQTASATQDEEPLSITSEKETPRVLTTGQLIFGEESIAPFFGKLITESQISPSSIESPQFAVWLACEAVNIKNTFVQSDSEYIVHWGELAIDAIGKNIIENLSNDKSPEAEEPRSLFLKEAMRVLEPGGVPDRLEASLRAAIKEKFTDEAVEILQLIKPRLPKILSRVYGIKNLAVQARNN